VREQLVVRDNDRMTALDLAIHTSTSFRRHIESRLRARRHAATAGLGGRSATAGRLR
ncbi:unnamed protein product, partial [Phaeothamnion confervicola]